MRGQANPGSRCRRRQMLHFSPIFRLRGLARAPKPSAPDRGRRLVPGKTALANPAVPATGPQPESSRCIPGRSQGWRNRASTSPRRRACVTTRPTGDGRAGSDHGALYLSANPPVSCTDLVMACPKGTSSRAALSRCGHDVRRVRASAPSSCRPSRSLGRGSSWVFQKTLAGKRHWATSRAGR